MSAWKNSPASRTDTPNRPIVLNVAPCSRGRRRACVARASATSSVTHSAAVMTTCASRTARMPPPSAIAVTAATEESVPKIRRTVTRNWSRPSADSAADANDASSEPKSTSAPRRTLSSTTWPCASAPLMNVSAMKREPSSAAAAATIDATRNTENDVSMTARSSSSSSLARARARKRTVACPKPSSRFERYADMIVSSANTP